MTSWEETMSFDPWPDSGNADVGSISGYVAYYKALH